MDINLMIALGVVAGVLLYVFWDRRRRGEPINPQAYARDVASTIDDSLILKYLGPGQHLRDLANALSRWELEPLADIIDKPPAQQLEAARQLARDLINDQSALDRFKPAWWYQLEKRLRSDEFEQIRAAVEKELSSRKQAIGVG